MANVVLPQVTKVSEMNKDATNLLIEENGQIKRVSANKFTNNKLDTIESGANYFNLTENCIKNTHIENNAITNEKLQDNVITENKIADQSINTSKLIDNSITIEKIHKNTLDILSSVQCYSGTLQANQWVESVSELGNYATFEKKWKWERFASDGSKLTENIREELKDISPTQINYYADSSLSTSMNITDTYIARCTTYIYCHSDINFIVSVTTDDDSCTYINGKFLGYIASANTATQMTFPFKKGVNIVEIIYREGTGGDGWVLSPSLSSNVGTTFSAMYAEPGFTYYQNFMPILIGNGENVVNENTLFSPGMILNGNVAATKNRDKINSGYLVGEQDGTITVYYEGLTPIDQDITMFWFAKNIN